MEKVLDVVVVGAGPAGLQMAYYLQHGNEKPADYLIVERESIGFAFTKFPRANHLISYNKRFGPYDDPETKLRWDWNSLLDKDLNSQSFSDSCTQLEPENHELISYLQRYANQFGIHPIKDEVRKISRVQPAAGRQTTFRVEFKDRQPVFTEVVVVATGVPDPHIPPIPGIELAEGYENCSINPDDYTNQRVLIIGKGNSGFEISDLMLHTAGLVHLASPSPVKFAWKTRHPGHVRLRYCNVVDMYQLKTLNSMLDGHVLSLEKREIAGKQKIVATIAYSHADGEVDELAYDRVIRACGFKCNLNYFDEETKPAFTKITLGDRFPEMAPNFESVNQTGVFFAGGLAQSLDFQHSASPFISGFRWNIFSLFNMFQEKFRKIPLPSTNVEGSSLDDFAVKLTDLIIDRACKAPALWSAFGFQCDVLHFPELTNDNFTAKYIYQLTTPYAADRYKADRYFHFSFDWGTAPDLMRVDRHPSADRAHESAFLHPIIKYFSNGELISEHHLLEDLVGIFSGRAHTGIILTHNGKSMDQYHEEVHRQPTIKYFKSIFSTILSEQ